jgi:phytoene desaturase
VHIHLNTAVSSIIVENGKAIGVQTNQGKFLADVVVGAADYHHVESNLLEAPYRQYTEQYWDKRKMAPSCLLYYIGLNKRIPNMRHHTLFFDTDFELHSQEIYTHPQWPKNPLFYASAPSVTDPSVAPDGYENLFLLIPVAPGLTGDDEATREKYLQLMLQRMEQKLGVQIADHVVYKKSYSIQNFIADYNAFKGNAYGLANTLSQTAVLKPRLKHKKVKGLYFAGQLTVPGPGVPPSIISGKVCATQILKDFKTKA